MIGDALSEAAAALVGRKFSADELPMVDEAFARFGRKRPSDDMAEWAAELQRLVSGGRSRFLAGISFTTGAKARRFQTSEATKS
jgi:hypothetical protein